MADELGDQVAFKSLDVDENQQTAAQMQVQGIPTFIVKKTVKSLTESWAWNQPLGQDCPNTLTRYDIVVSSNF